MPSLDVDALYDEFASRPDDTRQGQDQQHEPSEAQPQEAQQDSPQVVLHDYSIPSDNTLRCAFCNDRSPLGAAMPRSWEWTKEARIACFRCAPLVNRRSRR